MDSLIKFLKIILLVVGILIGFGLLGGLFFLFKGVQSGDLKSYVAKTAIEAVVDETNLSPTQQNLLEAGDYGALAEDIQQNITPEQVNCAVQILGQERAEELVRTQDPTPQEVLKLSKCL